MVFHLNFNFLNLFTIMLYIRFSCVDSVYSFMYTALEIRIATLKKVMPQWVPLGIGINGP